MASHIKLMKPIPGFCRGEEHSLTAKASKIHLKLHSLRNLLLKGSTIQS